jgi:hypothetical protein
MHDVKWRKVIGIVILLVLLLVTLPAIVIAATGAEIRANAITNGGTEAQAAKALGATNYQQSAPINLGYIGYGASKETITKTSQEIRGYAIQNGGTEVQAAKLVK